jgi:poly [ADP-ribose] polymerase
MELIYNINIMNQQMKEIGYDSNKMPLGKLGKETLKEGYEILKEIEAVLDGKKKGNLYDLSSKFYTKIPHDFGFK